MDRRVPGQALGGTQLNNTWRYSVYMQMKQVIWVLKADARVTVRKYNNWLWNAFSVIFLCMMRLSCKIPRNARVFKYSNILPHILNYIVS